MSLSSRIDISREDLYEKVWSSPMSKLCKEFGLSDKGLAKICHRNQIPVPGSSYWRRIQLGQTPPKLPLPKIEHDIEIRLPGPKPIHNWPEIPNIPVPLKLTNAHRLVSDTKEVLEAKKDRDSQNMYHPRKPTLSIRVSKRATSRALRIMNTIINEIENRGGRVEIREDHGTFVNINRQSFQISLMELNKREEHKVSPTAKPYEYHPRYDFIPTGELQFKIEAYCDGLSTTFQDRTKTRLEDKVGEIIRNLELLAEIYKQRDIEREKERRAWEAEREKQRQEESRAKRLLEEVNYFEDTERIKRYFHEITNSYPSIQEPEWVDWIKSYIVRRESRKPVKMDSIY